MCGVIGLKSLASGPVNELAYHMLTRLQHRGQDGAGLSVLGASGHFETLKGLGLISHALLNFPQLAPGTMAVAHTRYATTGTGGVAEVQPFVKGVPKFALAHNGNIVNVAELTEKFGLEMDLETDSDLDVLQQVFLKERIKSGFRGALQTIFDTFNGSYATVGGDEDGSLFGFRDPFGLRPLFFGRSKELFAFASETCAMAPLGLEVEELAPGEWVRIAPNGEVERGRLTSKLNPSQGERFCMFEAVYFSSPQSEIHSKSVYRLRFQLGMRLAREIMNDLPSESQAREVYDFVVPVPETSRTAAIAVAENLRVPYREYLVKNPYVPRTFILGSQDLRLKALESKLSLIGPEIKGQRILLVDDSVVRGNTSRLMALRLREAGAKSVSLASTCPPIRHGCFYGIDFPDPEELVAHQRNVSEICEQLGVDRLHYLSIEGLRAALGSSSFCTACLDGDYPTRDASFERFLTDRRGQRVKPVLPGHVMASDSQ